MINYNAVVIFIEIFMLLQYQLQILLKKFMNMSPLLF